MTSELLCVCGSGLRAVRCCESDPAQWPGLDAAALLDKDAARAAEAFNKKQHDEAESLALTILDAIPNHRVALRVLFELRRTQKRFKTADIIGARYADAPGTPAQRAEATERFAQYLIGQGAHARAQPFAARLVKSRPRVAAAHHMMGVVLTETGSLLAGEQHYRQALALSETQDGVVLANLAWNLKCQGRLQEALALYDQALAIRPETQRGLGGRAQVLFALGRREEAEALLATGRARWPDDRFLRMLQLMADLAGQRPQAVLDQLNAPDTLLPAELLMRGQAFMQQEHAALALGAIATARTLQRERTGICFQPQPLQDRLARYKAYFQEARTRPLPRATAGAFTPVFLLGFPRSGSSLLEQLLAQIPAFAPGDNAVPLETLIPVVSGLLGGGAYPEVLDELLVGEGAHTPDRLRALYEDTRRKLGLVGPQTGFVTDRSAGNVWHLGLIKLLYPEAPIIHVLRHPYDLMLSNIAQDRKLEFDAQAGLPGLARYFDLHAQMLKHYRGQLTLRYLPVRYEELVAAPEAVIARVLAFIGVRTRVPKDLAANARPVSEPLPGHFAVRAPVHQRAVRRFEAYRHAVPHLFDEIAPILDPWVRELGYGEPDS